MTVPDPSPRVTPSPMDTDHLALLRQNIPDFLRRVTALHMSANALVLDIGPQPSNAARDYLPRGIILETLDIDPGARCTYTADICKTNRDIPDAKFDAIICTEVLEHTRNPFLAINELYRITQPGGVLFLSTPFNFRIHGPLPDCWRFSEHGLRCLLERFEILELSALETPGRPLMPIQYTTVARRPL